MGRTRGGPEQLTVASRRSAPKDTGVGAALREEVLLARSDEARVAEAERITKLSHKFDKAFRAAHGIEGDEPLTAQQISRLVEDALRRREYLAKEREARFYARGSPGGREPRHSLLAPGGQYHRGRGTQTRGR